MSSQKDKIDLSKNTIDYVTSTLKAFLGSIPCAGPLLAEIAGEIIPNQRVDRIVEFAKILDVRISQLEKDFVKSQMKDEYFTDLVEEGIRQASRAITKDRKEYIASIIKNSLSSEKISYTESKHLLKLLGELNDIEIIWLKSFSLASIDRRQEFTKKHENILKPVWTSKNSDQSERNKAAIQKSYKEHLVQLGLLNYRYQQTIENRNEMKTEFDNHTGGLKVEGYKLSKIGELLLRELELLNH